MVATLKVDRIQKVNSDSDSLTFHDTGITLNKPLTKSDGSVLVDPSSGAGKVLQVKQAVISNTQSTATGNTWLALSDFNISITPASANSKFLLQLHTVIGMAYWQIGFRFKRDSTAVGIGDADGSRPRGSMVYNSYDFGATNPTGGGGTYTLRPMSSQFLDSPSTTSAITYGVDWKGYSTSYTIYLNRSYTNSNASSYEDRPISTFTVMEIAS
jgi:hypothetical protein